MSSGSAKILYNLGSQKVDLVLNESGITVDNRPMNQTKLVAHKGFDNAISFFVRNRDRKLQDISSKTLYANVINPNTKRRVMFKQLDLVSGSTGEATLNLVTGDLIDLAPGLYHIALSESSDLGVTQFPLYANQNDRIVTDLEIRSSLEYEPVSTQVETNFTQIANVALGDTSNIFISSAMYGNQEKNFRHSRHTIAFYMNEFVGNVTIQGSALETVPTQETDWYNINPQGDFGQEVIPYTTAYSGIDPFNFKINTNWIRLKIVQTSGTFNKVLLRN